MEANRKLEHINVKCVAHGEEQNNMHIDVRGPWPVFISGMLAITLPHTPRNISVEEGLRIAKQLILEKENNVQVRYLS